MTTLAWGGAPLAAVVALSALRSAVAQEPRVPPPVESTAPVASTGSVSSDDRREPPDYCVRRFLSPLEAMAGVLPVDATGVGGAKAANGARPEGSWLERIRVAAQQLRGRFAGTAPPAIDAIIATVADPIDSGLDSQFESSVEALGLGAEHTWPGEPALFRDRSWLPWDDRAVPEASRRDSEGCRASTPGVMLFRSSEIATPRLLALLVVGESPSAGVHRAALRNALVARDAFVADVQSSSSLDEMQSSERLVRVVGPTFSGSAYSLRLSLREWAQESTRVLSPPGNQGIAFRVVTGTATGSDVPTLLGANIESLAEGARLSFQSTTITEADAECAYLWFLRKRMMVPLRDPKDPARGLEGVAALRESGTEFGAPGAIAVGHSSCPLSPSLTLRFPFHVSALRDAYETLEKGAPKGDPRAAPVRATSLPAPMQEKHLPLELAATSAKSRAALDLTLSNVLAQISSRDLRYVSIHSTDIGDAIFLARKIRDVAPDVRLAFFDANALLVHPDFRRELVGSFVVTPYPFLGVHPFVRSNPIWSKKIAGFASSAAEGLFNALLVQRGAPPEALSDYVFNDGVSPAPLWIASVGRGALVPVAARPVPDCNGSLYGAVHSSEEAALCSARRGDAGGKKTWEAFNTLPRAPFTLDAALTRPRLWDFVFCLAVLAFCLDWWRERWVARDFDIGSDEFEAHSDERTWDRFIARTKWGLYSVIRAYLFALALTYMGALYLAAASARDVFRRPDSATAAIAMLPEILLLACGIASWIASLVRTAQALRPYLHDYGLLGRKVGSNLVFPYVLDQSNAIEFARPSQTIRPLPAGRDGGTPLEASSRWRRMLVSIGVAKPRHRDECARVSFGQLRVLTCATAICAVGFSLLIAIDALQSSDWSTRVAGPSVVARAVLVLRSIPLTNGVSPAAAVLLCIGCAYLWAVGRMSRLHLAEKVSMLCSGDNVVDLVSTPIRQILQPMDPARQGARAGTDEGLTLVERDVLDSIWRPITGRYFVVATVVIAAVPLVLFHLKPFSSIEAWAGSALLGLGLALCVYLVGVTLLQLVQYWLSLERLLKRVMEHRLGPAFTTVAPFATDSVDRLVSRSTSDLLRWTASARQFVNLVAAAEEKTTRAMLGQNVEELEECVIAVEEARQAVLSDPAGTQPGKLPSAREAELGAAVVTAAARLMLILEQAWPHQEAQPKSVHQLPAPPLLATGTDSASAMRAAPRRDRQVHDEEYAESLPVATVRESGAAPAESRESGSAPARRRPQAPTSDDAPVPSVHDAFAPIAYSFQGAQLSWLRRAQSLVATVVTLLLHRHVRQFRYFLYVLTGCALLLLVVVTSYPFQPFRLLLTYLWVITGSVVTACLWVYVQMERNTLLSHTSGTAPNEVTFDRAFLLRVLTWGVIPLLGVAATQYPQFANLVFELLSPFASALQ